MSAFGTVVDSACCTIGKTKVLLEILTDHMKELTIQDVSAIPQVVLRYFHPRPPHLPLPLQQQQPLALRPP